MMLQNLLFSIQQLLKGNMNYLNIFKEIRITQIKIIDLLMIIFCGAVKLLIFPNETKK